MKKLGIIFMLILSFTAEARAMNMKVLMLISEGFYAPEYFVPRKAFEERGYEIVVATRYAIPTAPDRRLINEYPAVTGDITFDKIQVADFDAIVFVGGNGAWEDFFPNEDVHRALNEFMKAGKVVALICSATGLLGVANNLSGEGEPIAKGRHVTGYGRVSGILKKLGQVNYDAGVEGVPHVVIDGKLVTGRDPQSSALFGKKVIEVLER